MIILALIKQNGKGLNYLPTAVLLSVQNVILCCRSDVSTSRRMVVLLSLRQPIFTAEPFQQGKNRRD